MKATINVEGLFPKYNVKLRYCSTVVTHAVYETKKTVTPLQFAVYETAIKAVALGWRNARGPQPHFDNTATPVEDSVDWFSELARKDGFRLHYDPKISSEEASKDYYACVDWLTDEGLYYDLLD